MANGLGQICTEALHALGLSAIASEHAAIVEQAMQTIAAALGCPDQTPLAEPQRILACRDFLRDLRRRVADCAPAKGQVPQELRKRMPALQNCAINCASPPENGRSDTAWLDPMRWRPLGEAVERLCRDYSDCYRQIQEATLDLVDKVIEHQDRPIQRAFASHRDMLTQTGEENDCTIIEMLARPPRQAGTATPTPRLLEREAGGAEGGE